jgi:hypothetical protein
VGNGKQNERNEGEFLIERSTLETGKEFSPFYSSYATTNESLSLSLSFFLHSSKKSPHLHSQTHFLYLSFFSFLFSRQKNFSFVFSSRVKLAAFPQISLNETA